MSVVDILLNYSATLFSGLLVTLELFLSASVVGIGLGVLLGWAAAKRHAVGVGVRVGSFFMASVPFLVLLYWFYYPLQSLLDISLSPFSTAFLVLALVDTAAIAELIRTTLAEFPRQYVIVGQMSGLSERQILQKIQFPMTLRQIAPSLLATQIYIFQLTVLSSLISVQEIFRVAQNVNAVIYKPVEIYTSLALFFVLVLAPLSYLAYMLKQRLTRDLSDN
jgi:His/Glu/Gln/Arg/opine family amino acid ABC transporter permease subunit